MPLIEGSFCGEQGAGGTCLTVAYLLVGLRPTFLSLPVAMLLSGAGFVIAHSTLQTRATDLAPAQLGTAVALFAFAVFLGGCLGTALAGAAIAAAGFGVTLVGTAFALAPFTLLSGPLLCRVQGSSAEGKDCFGLAHASRDRLVSSLRLVVLRCHAPAGAALVVVEIRQSQPLLHRRMVRLLIGLTVSAKPPQVACFRLTRFVSESESARVRIVRRSGRGASICARRTHAGLGLWQAMKLGFPD